MASVRSINKVIIVGNVTRDAELRYTPKGTAVCTISIATNRAWKDANGNKQEEATFHRVTAWGKAAELFGKLIKKGMKVYIEGGLHYTDKRGEDGKIIARQADIRADELVILDSVKRDDGAPAASTPQNTGGDDTNDNVGVDKIDIDSIMEQMDGEAEPASSGKQSKADVTDDLPF